MLKKYILPGFLLITVLGFVFNYWEDLRSSLYGVNKAWGISGFLFIVINYLLRTFRLNILTKKDLVVWPLGFYCTSFHGFLNYMLPLRTGDLSLPFILKNTSNIDLKVGATVLYKAKLLEVFTLGIWIVLVAMFPFSSLPNSIMVAMFFLGGGMILTPFFLCIVLNKVRLPFNRVRHITKHLAQTSQMTFQEVILTFGIWASIASCIVCIARAMQLPISLAEIGFLIALQLVMQLMPVQGLANSGNHESGWVAALMLMNYPADQALKFALTSHAIILSYVLILGLIAFTIKLGWIRKQN